MNQTTVHVRWGQCFSEPLLRQHVVWCGLSRVDLNDGSFDGLGGVYIIWHGGVTPAYVRVGQGVIRDRIAAHRVDAEILAFGADELFVTWAEVPAEQRDGVEQYLIDRLQPKAGIRGPGVAPLPINLPRE